MTEELSRFDERWEHLFDTCSNRGRWGPDDQKGTLNFITTETVLQAVATVRHGDVISIAYDLPVGGSSEGTPLATLRVAHQGARSRGAADTITIAPHGFAITHVDAVGHAFHHGNAYNGRQAGDVLSEDGLRFGSVTAMAGGVVTRGVLLDVADTRGVRTLLEGEGISCRDLLDAERRSGSTVHDGDAVFVRSGIGQDTRWSSAQNTAWRPGVLPEVIPWLYDRRVAVYSGDCIERLSAAGDKGDMPLHEIGLAAMGLVLLDNPNVEVIRRACIKHKRWDFLVIIAPLRIPGATGSAVNPLLVF